MDLDYFKYRYSYICPSLLMDMSLLSILKSSLNPVYDIKNFYSEKYDAKRYLANIFTRGAGYGVVAGVVASFCSEMHPVYLMTMCGLQTSVVYPLSLVLFHGKSIREDLNEVSRDLIFLRDGIAKNFLNFENLPEFRNPGASVDEANLNRNYLEYFELE